MRRYSTRYSNSTASHPWLSSVCLRCRSRGQVRLPRMRRYMRLLPMTAQPSIESQWVMPLTSMLLCKKYYKIQSFPYQKMKVDEERAPFWYVKQDGLECRCRGIQMFWQFCTFRNHHWPVIECTWPKTTSLPLVPGFTVHFDSMTCRRE